MREQYSDRFLKDILARAQRVAVVGLSSKQTRPSFFVGRYLKLRGYALTPVNPAYVGQSFLGLPYVASLADVPQDCDFLDIFRRSEDVMPIVEEALERLPGLQTIWMQIGVVHEEAAAYARARGVDVVMDRCPKIEHQRLFGELRKGGFNTGVISSKL
ncbi:CoA-binding protein [uncultured Lentibacter sp.]|jgi:predicted CoA-binding protein|uniref:CoA-binding protein n=1 Tax=uncultured Lentibacter sp. TaxID=1659309 RepID=UPI0026076263|nr:CoA-binding protein [uncultured Lentibacter sp.]